MASRRRKVQGSLTFGMSSMSTLEVHVDSDRFLGPAASYVGAMSRRPPRGANPHAIGTLDRTRTFGAHVVQSGGASLRFVTAVEGLLILGAGIESEHPVEDVQREVGSTIPANAPADDLA